MNTISMDQSLVKDLIKTKLRVLEKDISEILIKWDQTSASEMIELTRAGKIPEAEPDAIVLTNLLDRQIEFEKLLLKIEGKAISTRKKIKFNTPKSNYSHERETMKEDLHDLLWLVVVKHPQDYEPYGTALRDGSDCSCGCKWFLPLECLPHDWGVCVNEKSHRVGMVTFEHQGCLQFVNKKEKSENELDVILEKIKGKYDYTLEKLANNK